jgi:hypothetical protein
MSNVESGALELSEPPEEKTNEARNDKRGPCTALVVRAPVEVPIAPSSTTHRKTKSDGDATSHKKLLLVQFLALRAQGGGSQESSQARNETSDWDETLDEDTAATALLELARSNGAGQEGASLSPDGIQERHGRY